MKEIYFITALRVWARWARSCLAAIHPATQYLPPMPAAASRLPVLAELTAPGAVMARRACAWVPSGQRAGAPFRPVAGA